jgi:uncharacterized protein YijF (DUF1287 family)
MIRGPPWYPWHGAAADEPWYDASETVLKKPGKVKPKKRARKPAPAVAHAPGRSASAGPTTGKAAGTAPLIKLTLPGFGAALTAAQKLPPVRKAPPVRPMARPLPVSAPLALRPEIAPLNARAAAKPADDRFTMALLMVPFLIVALSLGMTQSRRGGVPAMPDVVAGPPIQQPRQQPVALAPVASQIAPPQIVVPGRIDYPTAAPTIEIASLDVRPAPPVAAPQPQALPQPDVRVPDMIVPDVVVPGPALAYPQAAPEIPMIAHVPPLMAPDALAYPPPSATLAAPEISIASLDVRPLAPPPPPAVADTGETVCRPTGEQLAAFSSIGRMVRAPRRPLLTGVDADTFGRRLSEAAVAQTRDLVVYSARYQAMAYPMGDVVPFYGACIDVVIRAYRQLGIDLQEEVQKARGRRGDTNIDHRRTENMRRFLEQKGASLPITHFPESYKPGDIVTYHRPFSRVSTSHIAIVTDIIAPSGRPMIVHNRGYGAQLEDALFVDRITGHYRYQGPTTPTQSSAAQKPTGQTAPVVRASLAAAAEAR